LKGRPSERGITLDAAAALAWVSSTYSTDTTLVLWGQSLGAGVATTAAAAHLSKRTSDDQISTIVKGENKKLDIKGLILEAPFTSIKDMLIAIYPQK